MNLDLSSAFLHYRNFVEHAMKLLTERLLSRREQDRNLWVNVVVMSLKAQFSDGVNLMTQIKQILDCEHLSTFPMAYKC